MILRMPSYYKKFSCTADKCTDSCCIGWEIDIDKDSMKFYRNVNGSFGKILCENISEIAVPHFILNKNQRCPLLNQNNLCNIFINLGEEHLCNICRDHPRYFAWYKNIKEGGIGLCCEAAAKIIMTESQLFSYYDIPTEPEGCEDYDDNFYDYLFEIREKIIGHMQAQDIPLKQRLNNILHYTYKLQNRYDNFSFGIEKIENINMTSEKENITDVLNFFNSLESMESRNLFSETISNTGNIIKAAENMFKNAPHIYKYLENTTVYFIWRHFLKSVFEDEFYSKIAFAVLSAVVLAVMSANEYQKNNGISENDMIKIAVYYSKEIEYSEKNLNALFDSFYDNEFFSLDNIEKILNNFL